MRRFAWIGVFAAAVAAWFALDEQAGIPAWQRLRAERLTVQARIDLLAEEVASLRREAEALEHEDFALERAIREDLGLALPGETVVRLAADERAAPAAR